MNESRTNRILRALLRAGKQAPKLDKARAELGLETRLMAAIRARASAPESPWPIWNRWVWRAVPGLAALVVLLACLELLGPPGEPAANWWNDPLGLELALAERLGGGL